MNFFDKNRLIFWVLTVLVVVNISALVSFFIYPKTQEPNRPCCSPEEQQCNAFRDELNLSENQTLQVGEINRNYKSAAEPISMAIKQVRADIITELEQARPDTVQIDSLVNRLSGLQTNIQKENIKQYQALKQVCTTEQAHKLSALFRDLYRCPMKNR
jgi:Spy/CpxP family protein refolding chaperone